MAAAGPRPGVVLDRAESPASRWLRLSLAALWLLDAALQFQSFMFGPGFSGMLAKTAAGNPAVVGVPITWAAHLIGQRPAAANVLFATVQLALGLGIAWRPTVKIALGGSIAWAMAVWWLGEGFGGLLSGAANPVSGAPGAVIMYALVAVLLWPSGRRASRAAAPAARGAGPAAARAIWLLVWGGLAWLAVADRQAATVAVFRHLPGSLLLAAAFALVAAAVLLPAPILRGAIVLAVALSLALWAAGQDFGGIFTGTGTDPSTGPLLALLALAYWPGRAVAAAHPARPRPAGNGPAPRLAFPAAGPDALVMQTLMALGMAAMFVPGLLPLPATGWVALAAAGAAWFGCRFLRDIASARAGHLAAPGQHGTLSHRAAPDHLAHVLACGAMLYMFVASVPGQTASAAASIRMASTGMASTGMASMGTAGQAPGPAVALALAASLAGCTVVLTDRLAALRPACAARQHLASPPLTPGPGGAGPLPAGPGTADGNPAGRGAAARGLLVRRIAACCQVAMGVGMACMLVQLL